MISQCVVCYGGAQFTFKSFCENSNSHNCHIGMASFRHELLVSVLLLKCSTLHKCTECLFFGKFNINHINVILLVSFQINLVYVRLFTETCKQTESSYKRLHIQERSIMVTHLPLSPAKLLGARKHDRTSCGDSRSHKKPK